MKERKLYLKLEAFKPSSMSNSDWQKHIDEIAPALGYFIIAFNELDSEVTDCLLELSGIETDQQIVSIYPLLSASSFSERTKSLSRLLKNAASKNGKSTELNAEINLLINQIQELGRIRNAYVHAEWSTIEMDKNTPYVNHKLKTDDSKLYHEYFNCALETIEGYEDEIEQIIDDLANLTKRLLA